MDGSLATEGGAEEAEDGGRRYVHQLDDGASDTDEDVHRSGDGKGNALGSLEGEGLGDDFTKEDLKVGDEGEGDDDGEGVGVDEGEWGEYVQPLLGEVQDDVGYGGLADPAECEAGGGGSELDRGEEFVDGVLELEGGAGAGAAEGDELLDAGLADADEGELGGDEEAAGQNEEGHHDYPEEHPLEH